MSQFANNACETLGGEKFNALSATFNPVNKSSLGDAGRHGVKNTWARWSGRSKSNSGISSRAPYGVPAVSKNRMKQAVISLGGQNTHYSGLGVGAHGHGIGVVPAAIGGPHAVARTPISIVKPTRQTSPTSGVQAPMNRSQGRVASAPVAAGGFCPKCFATWFAVGVIVFIGILFVR